MSYAVMLYFNPKTETIINELMVKLSNQMGVSELLPAGFRPHLTLTGFEDPPPEGFTDGLRLFASKNKRIPIRLSAVGAFQTDQGVVYLAPVVTSDLLVLHQRFYQMMNTFSIESNPYFAPGHWIPHCSVAYGLNSEKAGQAIAKILAMELSIQGDLVSIGLTEFVPIKELCIYPFAGDI